MPYTEEDIEEVVDAILEAAGVDPLTLTESQYHVVVATARELLYKSDFNK